VNRAAKFTRASRLSVILQSSRRPCSTSPRPANYSLDLGHETHSRSIFSRASKSRREKRSTRDPKARIETARKRGRDWTIVDFGSHLRAIFHAPRSFHRPFAVVGCSKHTVGCSGRRNRFREKKLCRSLLPPRPPSTLSHTRYLISRSIIRRCG